MVLIPALLPLAACIETAVNPRAGAQQTPACDDLPTADEPVDIEAACPLPGGSPWDIAVDWSWQDHVGVGEMHKFMPYIARFSDTDSDGAVSLADDVRTWLPVAPPVGAVLLGAGGTVLDRSNLWDDTTLTCTTLADVTPERTGIELELADSLSDRPSQIRTIGRDRHPRGPRRRRIDRARLGKRGVLGRGRNVLLPVRVEHRKPQRDDGGRP